MIKLRIGDKLHLRTSNHITITEFRDSEYVGIVWKDGTTGGLMISTINEYVKNGTLTHTPFPVHNLDEGLFEI